MPQEEEWVWVTGYKGTDRDMKCKNDYQFEIGKKFDMPEGEDAVLCDSGFHFCPRLKDVFDYYNIGFGRRYFEVSALVRKNGDRRGLWSTGIDKRTSKSIIFTRELTVDEILISAGVDFSDWTEEEKAMAIESGVSAITDARKAKQLVELGYSEAFSKWIINRGDFDSAYAVGQQKDLSMDMKVAAILG